MPHRIAWRERIVTLTPKDNTALAIGQYGHANSRETDVNLAGLQRFAPICRALSVPLSLPGNGGNCGEKV
jgi:hypothetical protein